MLILMKYLRCSDCLRMEEYVPKVMEAEERFIKVLGAPIPSFA
jgi:hypothetical protein